MKTSAKITIFFLTALFSSGMVAQETGLSLLESVEDKLLEAEELSIDFEVNIFIPENPEQTIQGNFYKKSDRYYLETEKVHKISNGKAVWSIDKSQNIAYITDADGENQMSPLSVIRNYEKSDYEYNLLDEYQLDGKNYRAIVIKPKNKNAEYTKMRFAIDEDDKPVQFFLLSRTGERYTFNFQSISYSLPEKEIQFEYRKSDYPEVTVEDLRLD